MKLCFKFIFIILLTILGISTSNAAQEFIPHAFTQSLLKNYTGEEKKLIEDDLKIIYGVFIAPKSPVAHPSYIATAGGPGSIKSTVLETYLHNQGNQNFVKADPDIYGLRYMVNTYIPATGPYAQSQSPAYLKIAYEKWRDGSNYIANTILNEAFSQHLNIAHGTTSTGPVMADLYKKLRGQGYKIVLLLCDTTDVIRTAAIKNREATFFQSTPEDAINKRKMFYERFPIYFEYANTINFYWTDQFKQPAILCATFNREEGLVIKDRAAFDKFKGQYDAARAAKPSLPLFESLIK